ncbi:cytochrome P450, partial [Rhodococcus sp. CX]|nr:cytochrome P450 [Rhodococcus sp. CX]
GRVAIERFLDRTTTLTVDDSHHGPAGHRTYRYEPTYILRGIAELHVDFTPAH